jgi:hypothetical protein
MLTHSGVAAFFFAELPPPFCRRDGHAGSRTRPGDDVTVEVDADAVGRERSGRLRDNR